MKPKQGSYRNFLYCLTHFEWQEQNSLPKQRYIFQIPKQKPITTPELFREAVIHTFPLDPPLTSGKYHFDALADSLYGGLLALPSLTPNHNLPVSVIWTWADAIPQNFLIQQVAFFYHVAQSFTVDNQQGGVALRLYLICANTHTKQSLQQLFSWYLN